MSDPITLPAPVIDQTGPHLSKWEREYSAFGLMLPKLLTTHRGKFVAVHDGQVVDCGDDRLALALRVLTKVGNVAIHIGFVSDGPQPISRSGVRRELQPFGDAQ
jgi:hypothetical protein